MLTLIEPSEDAVAGYRAALLRGWSSNTTRDVSTEELARLDADPALFVEQMRHPTGPITLPDGTVVPRLPGCIRWLWDGEFCGSINLRYRKGTPELPPHVSGHIGYAVVPWKQRRGYGTTALARMLPIAAATGLPWVELTCDLDNAGSARIIEANGGRRQADRASKRVYRIELR